MALALQFLTGKGINYYWNGSSFLKNSTLMKCVFLVSTYGFHLYVQIVLLLRRFDCLVKYQEICCTVKAKGIDNKKNINALSKNHTVYAIDLLGFGGSDKPPGFSYTMESWAELILHFLEEVVQKLTILIGNSVGSLACVIATSETESQQEDLVKGHVLLNCAGGMNNKAVFDDWRNVQLAQLDAMKKRVR